MLTSLRTLAVGRSHAIIGNVQNALALIDHARKFSTTALDTVSGLSSATSDGPLNIAVPHSDMESLRDLLDGELQRHIAIVHIDNLRKKDLASTKSQTTGRKIPLAERMHEYPSDGLDLKNIIQFPPKMALIPMKPIFLDVAWDYIDYDSKTQDGKAAPAAAPTPSPAKQESAPEAKSAPAKKGWFGFGR